VNVAKRDERPLSEHDWHSPAYVDDWIRRDVTRDDTRRPLLHQMLMIAPFAAGADIKVLDIGAGYGVVSEQVLSIFPHAHLTLQDYSAPMFVYARNRLRWNSSQVCYVFSDLSDPEWTSGLQGPFDLIVSGLAIHNLREHSLMRSCYGSIYQLLQPGGVFLDYDLFGLVEGGTGTHRGWLREAGFERTDCTWEEPPLGIIAAWPRNLETFRQDHNRRS